ncbi:MAG: glycosyltransferase [Lachnospiraceae bacterium]|nr:glycosyltransferase [Lachnospiraceae bacterium]
MNIVFVSNYFNHHQQSMSDRLYALCQEAGGSYTFMQTEAMEEERVRMGWGEVFRNAPYLANYWEKPEVCQQQIDEADAVIFGGTDEECYIQNRLKTGKPVWRYSERLYKNGRYKFISPRGLRKKFLDHTRYGRSRVYLLCAGAYVAGDYRLVLAYPGKKFRFGYFPACKQYEWETLWDGKTSRCGAGVSLFWAARMIDWKHPEVPIKLAGALKEAGYAFTLTMAGGGVMEETTRAYAKELQVEDRVVFLGNQNPDKVRTYMEKCDIYLTTSDYGEGWGAVINEAMNSGCAVVANKAMGAAPYLIEQGCNGFYYRNGHFEELLKYVEQLMKDADLRERLGRAAYESVRDNWNADVAAERLFACMCAELKGEKLPEFATGPLSKA